MDTGIAVAVRDIDLTLRRQRGMGASVKRLAAHIRGRLAGHPQLEQQLAVLKPAFAHKGSAVIGQVDRIVGAHMHPMGTRVLTFAP